MKRILTAFFLITIICLASVVVEAKSTHTVWMTTSYDGYATAYACSDSAAASARGNTEKGFVRAIIANANDRLSGSDERDPGETATKGYHKSQLSGSGELTTSYASAFIGDTEIVCSQYY